MILTLFSFSFSVKNFDIFLGPFFALFLFLLDKDFDIFHVLSFGQFLFVFDNSHFLFLCVEKEIIKNISLGLLYALKII